MLKWCCVRARCFNFLKKKKKSKKAQICCFFNDLLLLSREKTERDAITDEN